MRVRVGLMGKRWANWASLVFSIDIILERTENGPLVSLIKALADKNGIFGQISRIGNADIDGHEQFKVNLMSLPHWIKNVVDKFELLSNTIGTFRILSDLHPLTLQQIVDPGELFHLGYISEFKICDPEHAGKHCGCMANEGIHSP